MEYCFVLLRAYIYIYCIKSVINLYRNIKNSIKTLLMEIKFDEIIKLDKHTLYMQHTFPLKLIDLSIRLCTPLIKSFSN